MPIVNLQDLSEAREDIKTIEQVVNGPSGEKVRTRLGREISTLATLDERYDTFATETAQAIEDIRDDITLIGQNTDQAQQRADEAYDLADQIQSINKGGTGGETAAEARSNLEVYSKDEITTRLNSKLNKADNLSDLEDAEEARENLNVYDRAEVDALIASGGEGKILSIQNGGTGGTTVEEARTNLDVFSKTETNTAITNATKQATESIRGQAKIATTAIAQAGTNDTDIITAKKLRDAAFGFNQTYTDVTASRSINTVFTNPSPKPIFLAISVAISARTYAYIYCSADEATSEYSYLSSGSSTATLYAIVNPFEEYRLTGALSILKWRERS